MSARTLVSSFVLFGVLSVGALYGQGGANGTILGNVSDSVGVAVAKAGADVTNVATSITNHTQTTSGGDFTVPYLQPGTYRVTVQAAGFQKSITENVGLVVGQQVRVNAILKPGTVNEVTLGLDHDETAHNSD